MTTRSASRPTRCRARARHRVRGRGPQPGARPGTGLAGKDPEDALAGIAEPLPLLGALKDRYLAQVIGPRQKGLLEPLIDRRLDRAGGDLGRIVWPTTSPVSSPTTRSSSSGRKAGEHGPDVISVDPNGEITFLDSKWRGADTSISPSGRAHQTDKSFRMP